MKMIITKMKYTLILAFILQISLIPLTHAQSVRTTDDSVSSGKSVSENGTRAKDDSPVLRTQIKAGLHNLGSDIHDAWGTLRGDVRDAGKAGQKYIRNKRSKDSVASTAESSPEKRKEIVKVYSVSPKEKLFITNRHGEVSVSNWDKNEIRVEISIRVKGATDKLLQESLDLVTIKESRHDDKISLETKITERNENTLQSLLKNRPDIDYQVDYKVFMPGQGQPYTNATTGSDI